MIDAKVIEAFELMWGSFPEPVMLIDQSREILAINDACRDAGGVPGVKCSALGSPDSHKGCLANAALVFQRAQYSKNSIGGRDVIAFWMPVDGYPDIYVHFCVGATIDYDQFK